MSRLLLLLSPPLLVLALSSGCSDSAREQQAPNFLHQIIDAAPNAGPDCCLDVLAIGDLNGDGYDDIVSGSENAQKNGLVWYAYPDWEKHPIDSGNFTTDGQIADLDGDGDFDVIISHIGDGIYWYENQVGATGSVSWISHRLSEDYAHDIVVGDLDRNGLQDIVLTDKKKLLVLVQTENGWKRRVIDTIKGEGIALSDMDGDADLDVVFGASWFETPTEIVNAPFIRHMVDKRWPADTRVKAVDLDADGHKDLVLTVSEGKGPIVWYRAKPGVAKTQWIQHVIDPESMEGTHSLQVADMDNDGDFDVVTAQMHTSSEKQLIIYLNDNGTWHKQVLATHGSHNLRVADIDKDGDVDIVGKNYAGKYKPVEMWLNQTRSAPKVLSMDHWHYIAIDNNREYEQMGKLGLVFADVNNDQRTDVIAGSYVYLNPGKFLDTEWDKQKIRDQLDVYFSFTAPLADMEQERTILVGVTDGDELMWLWKQGNHWQSTKIGKLAKGRTQGYTTGRILAGKYDDLLLTRGKNLYLVKPSDDLLQPWILKHISSDIEEEGVAIGDLDGDGDQDIAGFDHQNEKNMLIWLENTAGNGLQWQRHIIGYGEQWLDRIAVVDINNDGTLDIVATEETQDTRYNARLYWFQAVVSKGRLQWKKHVIDRLRSINSLDVADMDEDGDFDLIVAEHTDFTGKEPVDDNLTLIYENRDEGGNWKKHIIDSAPRSSHLGARYHDLDGDGDKDIVSITWQQFQTLHLWRNDAPGKSAKIVP